MEFRILGQLEIADGGTAVRLESRRQRVLLALLLVAGGEVVSRDRLIEELWLGDPPPGADATLRSHLSRLRAVVGAERLETKPGGYALAVGRDEVDASRFQRLAAAGREAFAEGRAAEAAEVLRAALALWRGGALADFAYEPFAQSAIARLEEQRLVVTEDRIAADLALGRHADLAGELEALVAANPLRESLRVQLMLALYRSGRQAEALESFQSARRVLTDELGLEPGESLKQMQRRILAHDAALDLPDGGDRANVAVREHAMSAVAGVFVGREAEQERLLPELDEALKGHGRVFLISGEPGIGKSRLAEELARQAVSRGAQVLVGRCWEAGGAPAFWPFVQALRSYIRDRDPDLVRHHIGAGAAELAQILPEIHDLFPGLASPPASETDAARFRVFDAATTFLKNAATDQPLVLVLDDLHAADTPSLLLLQFVARALADSPMLVIGAFRDVDPSLTQPLSSAVAELSREPATRRISLVGLEQADVANFIEQLAELAPAERVVAAIHEATEGNPLFVGEVVRLLVTEGALDEVAASPAWRLAVPEGVKSVIRRRLRHLSDDCELVLVLAAVLGREFRLDALAQASGVSGDALLEVLDEAARARVISEAPGPPGRLRFAHALIRDTLVDELTPGRRAQLHRRVGDALETLYANDPRPHLTELAHHFIAAVPAGGADKATGYARRAGDQAAALLAYEEAVRLYGLALTLVRDGAARCELLLALGDTQARSGNRPAWKAAYRDAAELATGLGLSEHLAIAALGYGGRFVWDAARDDPDVMPLFERALAAIGTDDNPLRVRLLARLAAGPLRDASFAPERRSVISREALAAARRIGDAPTLAYALAGYVLGNDSPDDVLERMQLASELIEVAGAAGEKERLVEGHEVRLLIFLELGEIDSARAELEAMSRLATDLRQPSQQWFVAAYEALFALLEGRLDEAEDLIADAYAMGKHVQEWSAVVSYRLQLYALRRDQGRLDEMEEIVRASAEEYPTYPIWRCVLVHMMAELEREDEARERFHVLAADAFAALPAAQEWLVEVSLLSEAAHWLGDAPRAAILYDQLLPYADRFGAMYVEIGTGSVSRFLGLLAATQSRWSDGERHFKRALEMNARIGARPALARTRHDYAKMLLARGRPADAERARQLLREARDCFRELGMHS